MRGEWEGMRSMTWDDLYKQFKQKYPNAKVRDYVPFKEWYMPIINRTGIIVWLENGDIFAYFPKPKEPEEE